MPRGGTFCSSTVIVVSTFSWGCIDYELNARSESWLCSDVTEEVPTDERRFLPGGISLAGSRRPDL